MNGRGMMGAQLAPVGEGSVGGDASALAAAVRFFNQRCVSLR